MTAGDPFHTFGLWAPPRNGPTLGCRETDPREERCIEVVSRLPVVPLARRVGLWYLLFGLLWIGSQLLDRLVAEHDQYARWELLKGTLFVAVSAGVVTALIQREWRRRQQEEARFRSLVQNASDLCSVVDAAGIVRYVSPSVARLTGYQPAELVGQVGLAWIHPDDQRRVQRSVVRRLRQPGAGGTIAARVRCRDGAWLPLEASLTNLLDDPAVAGFVLNGRDIQERNQAERALQDQLDRLAALHAIDLAITGSLDVQRTAEIALDHMGAQPDVDAVAVLQFDPVREALTVIASLGVPESAITRTPFPAYEGLAGSTVLEQRVVSVANLAQHGHQFGRARRFAEAQFVGYYGVPLIAHGQVQGVLELLQREPRTPASGWLAFVQMLGDRLAVAMAHAALESGALRGVRDAPRRLGARAGVARRRYAGA